MNAGQQTPMPASPDDPGGGNGGFLTYWGAERSDLKMLERAMRENWPVRPEIKAMAVARTAKVIEKSDHERNVVQAARVLVMMDQANISRERMALDASPKGAAHVHYEYHNHQKLTEEQYQQRMARLQGDNGQDKHAGNGPQ